MVESRAEQLVQEYNAAEEELKEFAADPEVRPILEHYHYLINTRNEKLGEAVRTVKSELQRSNRDELTIQNIGAKKRMKVYYDIAHLRAYLPEDQIRLVMTEKVEYVLDDATLNRLVRQGEIDSRIVREAYREEAPTLASLPGTPKEWTMPPLPITEEE